MMHGVKKSELSGAASKEIIREQEEEEAPQIAHYRGLIERVLVLGGSGDGDDSPVDVAAIMATTGEALLLNPDLLTAWNVRRRALRVLLAAGEWQAAVQEMEFSVATIKVNPKSYGAWHHRRWLVGQALRGAPEGVPIKHELALCARLLDLDARNFHGWNYRWFLTEAFPEQVCLQDEFDFTTQMIYKDFSNYSAWHRRSVLVERMASGGVMSARVTKILADDLKLLKSIYFTEPADQSAWFYLRWLLDFAHQHTGDARELAREELGNIEELLAIEPDAPLALFAWCQLARKVMMGGGDEGGDRRDRLRARLRRLCILDPMRANMYHSMMI